MGVTTWRAKAPSNIALIKYMGKADAASNQPANSSLSYTLDHLVSVVEIEVSHRGMDVWEPLVGDGLVSLSLGPVSQERFLRHFQFLKMEFQIDGHYFVRSANNFPSDCGLASSASSFAALTKAAHKVAFDRGAPKSVVDAFTVEDLSALARKGSGSSCRSFFRPWSVWRGGGAESIELPFAELHHQVVVLEKEKKLVSSSEAHKRVVSSELFQGRATRAEHRLSELLAALGEQDWGRAYETTWAEFWDMHALFETSQPPFGYMSSKSLRVLEVVRSIWRDQGDGPLVTMDAGANVHLLYRMDQSQVAERLGARLCEFADVIGSPSLTGETS